MCWKRMEQRVYLCHHNAIDWVPIQCRAPNCKLSPMHPNTCTGPRCAQTCYQGRQEPERAEPWYIQDLCPACRSAGFAL